MSQGLDAEGVRRGLREFPGVEHRIEFVREKDGVAWINDSKGTNPDSTIKAVQAMTRPTILLLGVGNYDKKSDFAPLFEAFDGKVKAVIASGLNVPAIKLAAEKVFARVCERRAYDRYAKAGGRAGPKRGRGAAFPCGGKLGHI